MNFIAGISAAEDRIQNHFCRPNKVLAIGYQTFPILQAICAQTVGALGLKAVKKKRKEKERRKNRKKFFSMSR